MVKSINRVIMLNRLTPRKALTTLRLTKQGALKRLEMKTPDID